ncbi:MAG: hypothetical protein ACOVOQ_10095 [Flavobacterium sp.]
MKIANEILQQLGNNKFISMTGVKNLVALENGLQMRLPRNSSKANVLRIELTDSDTYSVTFYAYSNRDFSCPKVKEYNNIYAEQLQGIFTAQTGLLTKF